MEKGHERAREYGPRSVFGPSITLTCILVAMKRSIETGSFYFVISNTARLLNHNWASPESSNRKTTSSPICLCGRAIDAPAAIGLHCFPDPCNRKCSWCILPTSSTTWTIPLFTPWIEDNPRRIFSKVDNSYPRLGLVFCRVATPARDSIFFYVFRYFQWISFHCRFQCSAGNLQEQDQQMH